MPRLRLPLAARHVQSKVKLQCFRYVDGMVAVLFVNGLAGSAELPCLPRALCFPWTGLLRPGISGGRPSHRSVMAYHPPADYGRCCRLRLLLRLPQRKGPGAALDWQLPALRPAAAAGVPQQR